MDLTDKRMTRSVLWRHDSILSAAKHSILHHSLKFFVELVYLLFEHSIYVTGLIWSYLQFILYISTYSYVKYQIIREIYLEGVVLCCNFIGIVYWFRISFVSGKHLFPFIRSRLPRLLTPAPPGGRWWRWDIEESLGGVLAADSAQVLCWAISSYAFSPLLVTIKNKEKWKGNRKKVGLYFLLLVLGIPDAFIIRGILKKTKLIVHLTISHEA